MVDGLVGVGRLAGGEAWVCVAGVGEWWWAAAGGGCLAWGEAWGVS